MDIYIYSCIYIYTYHHIFALFLCGLKTYLKFMLGLKKIKVEWFENLVPGEQRPHFGQFLILTVCFRGRYVWAPQDWTHASQGTRLSTTKTHFYPKIPKLPSLNELGVSAVNFQAFSCVFFLTVISIFLFADVIFDQWHSSRIDIAAPSHHLPSTIDVQSFVRRPFEGSAVLRGSLAGSTGGVRGLNKAQQMAVGFVLLFWGPNRKTLSNYSQIGIEIKHMHGSHTPSKPSVGTLCWASAVTNWEKPTMQKRCASSGKSRDMVKVCQRYLE